MPVRSVASNLGGGGGRKVRKRWERRLDAPLKWLWWLLIFLSANFFISRTQHLYCRRE